MGQQVQRNPRKCVLCHLKAVKILTNDKHTQLNLASLLSMVLFLKRGDVLDPRSWLEWFYSQHQNSVAPPKLVGACPENSPFQVF